MAQTLYTTRQAKLKRLIEARGLSGTTSEVAAALDTPTAAEIAAVLNTPEQTGTRRVTMAEVQNALVARGKALAIASFLADPPAEHKTVARMIEFFLSGKQEDFNPFDASADDLFNMLMMLGLVG
jgi:hypothetical protein